RTAALGCEEEPSHRASTHPGISLPITSGPAHHGSRVPPQADADQEERSRSSEKGRSGGERPGRLLRHLDAQHEGETRRPAEDHDPAGAEREQASQLRLVDTGEAETEA